MSFEVQGKLYKIFDIQQVSGAFQKREFVLNVDGQYPQLVVFQLVQDRCNAIDGFKVNETVKVFFDLRGREWQSPQGELKYFNSLNAWKVDKAESEPQAIASAPSFTPSVSKSSSSSVSTNNVDAPSLDDYADDLPF